MKKTFLTVLAIFILVSGSVLGADLNKQADVVVVGGGIAGLTAAIEAADHGAEVILLEKMAFLGGSSLISGGVIYAADTDLQKEFGIDDSADAMFEYWMNHSHWILDPALVRIVSDESVNVYNWFKSLGVEFPSILGTVDDILYRTGGLYAGGIASTPRSHTAVQAGVGLTTPVIQKAQAHPGITIMMETTGIELIFENGEVVGVLAQNSEGRFEVRGSAVILATGGMGHNEELQRRFIPEIAAARSRVYVISVAGTTGDGIMMGLQVGAALVGMDQGAFMLAPSFAPGLGTPKWLIFVNQYGQRFIREDAPHPAMNEVARAQEDGLIWAICDDNAREGGWADIDELVADRKVVQADTLEELARMLGISPRGLRNTVERYNQDVAAGADTAFFKDSQFLKPIATAPFYGVQLVESTVGVPTGGLRISTRAEVLTAEGDVIQGLFAAGETTGGILGRYPSSGAAITDAVVFGKIAGREAAAR